MTFCRLCLLQIVRGIVYWVRLPRETMHICESCRSAVIRGERETVDETKEQA